MNLSGFFLSYIVMIYMNIGYGSEYVPILISDKIINGGFQHLPLYL